MVGGIACRCEKASGGARLYIMTLGVLPAYRGRGVGSQMVRNAIKLAEQDPNFLDVYLHVQVRQRRRAHGALRRVRTPRECASVPCACQRGVHARARC